MQPQISARSTGKYLNISTLEQHNLEAAAEIDSLKEEVQKPVSTVVTALLDKNAKHEQQAGKDQILAFFLSMQFFASSGLHYTNWLSCRCPTWRSI